MELFNKYQARILMLLFLSFSSSIYAQELSPVAQMVAEKIEDQGELPMINDAFEMSEFENIEIQEAFSNQENVDYFRYNNNVAAMNLDALTIRIPRANGDLLLDLVSVPSTFYDYIVTTSSGETYSGQSSNAKHYRGIVKGDNSSLVAISFVADDVMGIISIEGEGNYNLGKIEETNTFVLYSDLNMEDEFNFECGTEFIQHEEINSNESEGEGEDGGPTKCVKLYFETTFDIYQWYGGSVTSVESYVTRLFNQVAVLYQNEGIFIEISEIKVWDQKDPYYENIFGIGTWNRLCNTSQLKQKFQIERTSFNGDLGQLLVFDCDGISGEAANAGKNVLCEPDAIERLSVVRGLGANTNFSHVPNYSRSVYVSAHEFGHLFGSFHTHNCVWNGNNTAIDGCETTLGCTNPGTPSNGGTIMSYCGNTSVGINFYKGFGPQPGNVIRNNVSSASCLEACSCPDEVVVTTTVYPGFTSKKWAQNKLTTYNTVGNNTNVRYFAGNEVLIAPNSKILNGADYRAYIDDCYNPSNVNKTAFNPEENSLEDFEEKTIMLYPNPSRGLFSVELNNIENTNVEIQIYNSSGQQILNTNTSENTIYLDISEQAKGLYFVKILMNGINYSKKIILTE